MKTFVLQPFEVSDHTAELSLEVSVERSHALLSMVYVLSGDLSKVAITLPSANKQRRDRLWEQTCFEFFLTQEAAPYWEFNLSPAGDWNVFALSGYRQGLKEETAFAKLPFEVQVAANELRLEIAVDVSELIDASRPLKLGISAVVIAGGEDAGGEESFWAIAHPGPKADFHHPDSFVVAL